MVETTCPSLMDLGIQPGSFIRKLNSQNHWNTYVDEPSLSLASEKISEKIFNEPDAIYSLWQVSTEQEFYGVIACLTADATPKDRNVDFVWIAESELNEVGIKLKQEPEGKCLHVQDLHFNATISPKTAQRLCQNLLEKQRTAKRCKKAHTITIREYQHTLGCKAVDNSSPECHCEEW